MHELTSCKSYDCSDCKHNSHEVQMLLQLIVAIVDWSFPVQWVLFANQRCRCYALWLHLEMHVEELFDAAWLVTVSEPNLS